MTRQTLLLLAILGALLYGTSAVHAQAVLPPFAEVERVVLTHFAPSYDFKEGDLITKSDVQPVLAALASIGWQLPHPELILNRVLDDNDFLVKQLKSSKGRRLYDRVAKYPGALDRLDRMREMHGGNKTLEVFVQKTPNNYDLMKTITTTKRGQRFAKDIAKFDDGSKFNTPTGRIYRVSELLPALKQLYDRQLAEMMKR